MFAVTSFVHLDDAFDLGDKVAADHQMVALRPDLFSTTSPTKTKPHKEA